MTKPIYNIILVNHNLQYQAIANIFQGKLCDTVIITPRNVECN